MSVDYWNMKLSSVMVKYNGRFEAINDIVINDEDEYIMSDRYPEDTLPALGFQLNNGDIVGYEEFSIKFPTDRWVNYPAARHDRCIRGTRSLGRNYKMGPCSSNLDLYSYRGVGSGVQAYLNRCLVSPSYHNSLESLLWDTKGYSDQPSATSLLDDTLISHNCATLVEDSERKAIFYKNVIVAVVQRDFRKKKQKISMSHNYKGKIPAELQPLVQLSDCTLNIPDKGENLDEYFLNK